MEPLYSQSIKAAAFGIMAIVFVVLAIAGTYYAAAWLYPAEPGGAHRDMSPWTYSAIAGVSLALALTGVAAAWIASRHDGSPVHALRVASFAGLAVAVPLVLVMFMYPLYVLFSSDAGLPEDQSLSYKAFSSVLVQTFCFPFYIMLAFLCLGLSLVGAGIFISVKRIIGKGV